MALDMEVLIVSYASAAMIDHCLSSIVALVDSPRVAIREHSPHQSDWAAVQAVVARHDIEFRGEHDPSNPGFGAGCNALAAESTARWLLFLNPDTRIVSWPYNDRPPAPRTIVGPLFTAAPGEHAGRRYRIRDEIARSWLRRTGPLPTGRGFVSGAALLIEREQFERVGGFDPQYFLFYEDIDLCLRANALGVATIVDTAWSVEHARGHSTNDRFGQALLWSYESAVRFHGSQGSPVTGYRVYVAADALARGAVHSLRGNPTGARAYRSLLHRALTQRNRHRST